MSSMRASIGIVFAMCFAACAWVPDSGQFGYDRGVIPGQTRDRFVPGSCTRADVIGLLGAPAWVSRSEDRMLYRVRFVNSYWWIYLVAGIGFGGFCEIRSHLFEFDSAGGLTGYRIVKESAHHGGDGGPSPLLLLDRFEQVDYAAYFDTADSSASTR